MPIKINNKILELKQSTNYLEIELQSNLKWDNHINYLLSKLHEYNSILYLTRNYLTRSSLLSIYYSLVYSCISYSNIIWSKTYRLYKIKNFVKVKISFNSHYVYSQLSRSFDQLGIYKVFGHKLIIAKR